MMDLSFCTDRIIPLICDVVNECCENDYDIEIKSKGNYVTSMDIKIEEKLIQGLREILPGSGFISEEKGEELSSEYNWIIDPIDGTTNYIYGFPYCISVALTRKDVKNVILGVVCSPQNNRIYYGCKGNGSYVMDENIVKQLKMNGKCLDGIAIFGMPYNRGKVDKIFDIAKRYYELSADLKRIGPSSLDICLVAEGKAKVYFELDLKIWDIAAGMLILSEAGGECRQIEDLFVFGSKEMVELLERQ